MNGNDLEETQKKKKEKTKLKPINNQLPNMDRKPNHNQIWWLLRELTQMKDRQQIIFLKNL